MVRPGPSAPTAAQVKEEKQARRSKSSRKQIKFTVFFTNRTSKNINLIWKDYEGNEVIIQRDMVAGQTHREPTYLTHPYIARDSATNKLMPFFHESTSSVVFEGLNFHVQHDGVIEVDISEEISL